MGDACCCEVKADLDGDGAVNVTDLAFLVDYLFRGQTGPDCPSEGDVDASGSTDVADLTYLLDYLFGGGPSPGDCT